MTNAPNNPGLIVPIDLKALCVGTDPGPIFEQNPFNFSLLANNPYLSSSIAAGGLNKMSQGVHLHWALPDSLTQGRQDGSSTLFPAVPDRWLVTRIFCDPDKPAKPALFSWVIESNYYADTDPNDGRTTITIPFSGNDVAQQNTQQVWKFMGRVSTLDEWMAANANGPADDSFLASLSAVGYGQPDFSASYQNSQNVLGFNDLGSELSQLGTAGSDKYVSYQVIGWYSNPSNDPIQQLPNALPSAAYNTLLAAITNAGDKTFFTANYPVGKYALVNNVAPDVGKQLWSILEKAGYPLQINIPLAITPADFATVMAKLDTADQAVLQANYPPVMMLAGNLAATDISRMYGILSTAGFDFLGQVLQKANWSIPSGTATPGVAPAYTLYSGIITNIPWNGTANYFTSNPGNNFNIAIGNTAEEALSTLIANTSGFDQDKIAEVEEILNALQTGILSKVTNESMLSDWEELETTLHKNSFSSQKGGLIWEIKQSNTDPQNTGEITLPEALAKQLNDLNTSQQQYDEYTAQVKSQKIQIFSDWYRFMQIQYVTPPPPGNIQLAFLNMYMEQKITVLGQLEQQVQNAATTVTNQRDALNNVLGNTYFLSQVSAPRYWQPNDPVMLFQGDGIDPSDRFGNDGMFMYNNTLMCRLSAQLLSQVQVPARALGNAGALTLDVSSFIFPTFSGTGAQAGIAAVLLDGALLNPDVIAAELIAAGPAQPLGTLAGNIEPLIEAFLNPGLPQQLTQAQFTAITDSIYTADVSFLKSVYTQDGAVYNLNPNPGDNDALRIKYILNSVSYNPSSATLVYAGIPVSQMGVETWAGNPWMPFSLKWSVYYYPLDNLNAGAKTYTDDFITSNFIFGNTDLVYNGPEVDVTTAGIEQYNNAIFLTPHASINLQKQLANFINQHPDDAIIDELKAILAKLGDKPVLSQALSGFNDALLMQHRMMQLPVADPQSGDYSSFTNVDVHNAVENQRTQMPAPGFSFNPIRTGLMKIAGITLVDVFGRNVTVGQGPVIYTPYSMQQNTQPPHIIKPLGNIYLPPRLTQPARLQFRWLAADDDTIEMNSHPATSPICGWALTNLLDDSLWIYDAYGNAYGSLILQAGLAGILWQATPGSPYFGYTIQQFFAAMPDANPHLKDFVMGLYGDGKANAAAYLDAFMRALDVASVTIEPGNYKQYSSNAVLMGRPMALVRASINLELQGEPAYSQSWADLSTEVNEYIMQSNYIPGLDYNFTNVNFPVKIGNIPQTEDGLLGYFKDGNYSTFYAPAVTQASNGVEPPPDDNLVVTCTTGATPIVISMLIEPRGKIHATTGILPVKAIDIPPDQYLDALQKLQLCFLTSPVLTSQATLNMPLPAQTGGVWSWIENDGTAWSEKMQISPISTVAELNYAPQQLLEGWLSLASMVLGSNCFSIVNIKAQAPLLFITNDASLNALTFTLINKTGTVLQLTGGAPVARPYKQGGSSFVFNFGNILPDSVLSALTVSGTGWTAQYFVADQYAAAAWAIAPNSDITLDTNASVTFSITGIVCAAGTLPGNFQVYYYNLPDLSNSMAPTLLPISVLSPPVTTKNQ